MFKIQGFTEAGNTTLLITGAAGIITRKVQGSFPLATITVFDAGTVTLSAIYADDNPLPNAKANPFVSTSDGTWYFYAPNGRYDVRFSGGGIAVPFTIGDLSAGVGNSGVPSYSTALLPPSKPQSIGNLARLTDDIRGLWMNNGVSWNPLIAVANAVEFPGGDWVAKTQAAHDSINGVAFIDMRGFRGSQTTATTLVITKACVLILPENTLGSTAPTRMINLTISGAGMLGPGSNLCTFLYNPPGPATAIYGEQPGTSMVDCRLSGFTIDGTGNTQLKTALDLIDINETQVRDVSVNHWSNPAKACVGIRIRGRQSGFFQGLRVFADLPFRLSTSPNTTGVSFDHMHFQDIYVIADLTQPCWLIDPDVWPTDCVWNGYQAWVVGFHGVQWDGYNGAINAYNIAFYNVRTEQGAGAASGAYVFHLAPIRQTFGVTIDNYTTDNTHNGVFVRNIKNLSLRASFYQGAGVALNTDVASLSVETANFQDLTAGATITAPRRIVVGQDENGSGSECWPRINLTDEIAGALAGYFVNGGQIGANIAAAGSGAVYTITTTQAAITFGGTSPAIVLDKTGTYMISGRVVLRYVAYDAPLQADIRQVVLKLRRTNNTPSDLTGGTTAFDTVVVAAPVTETAMVIPLPTVVYGPTSATNDAITIFAALNLNVVAGSITVAEAEILAVRIR